MTRVALRALLGLAALAALLVLLIAGFEAGLAVFGG